jgi:hypothetical protein
MSSNDDRDAKAAQASDKKVKRGKQWADESPPGRASLSVGREAEIDAGADTQMAPGILDSGTF